MRLNKIKFARLISFLGTLANRDLDDHELEWIDQHIDIDVEPVEPVETGKIANAAEVNELLKQLIASDGFIPAIQIYSSLTGASLIESRKVLEPYRDRLISTQ
jgi:hypothetical protein